MELITWWQAIILGLVQGLTEFIPVSSSAHLNIAHWLMGQPREHVFTYDMVLNLGTLAALFFYYKSDWVNLLRDKSQRKLRNLVFLACVPAVIAGLLLRHLEDSAPLFKDVQFNATMLIVMGMLLWWADHIGRKRRNLTQANWKDAVTVGCSQALALIPGVSRSGATITAGLFRRLKRPDAARFSFLMSLPITLGAVVFEIYGLFKHGGLSQINADPFTVCLGIGVAAASGFWAIGFLLNYLRTKDVTLFVAWRVLVALLVFVVLHFRR
jgi:undecaprenyl-diphosphatase